MTERQLKKLFAEAWLRNPDNAFAAAQDVIPGNNQLAVEISSNWTIDPEVHQLKKELIATHGEEYFLPSKSSMVTDILRRANRCPNNDDYVKLMKLAADMRGMIEKPGAVTINNSVTTNKVMVVPLRMNQDGGVIDSHEWEQQLISQQQGLVANG